MKTLACSIFFLLVRCVCFSQSEVKVYTELSQSLHTSVFTTTNVGIGFSVITSKNMTTIFSLYQFGGNFKRKFSSSYEMNYHLLGGGLKYRFRSLSKKYSPTIQISSTTEIVSPYRGKFLGTFPFETNDYGLGPTNKYITQKVTYDGESYNTYNYAYYYVSTPLVLSIIVGHEFRLTKGLNFNVGIGYSARAVKARLKKWGAGTTEPPSDISETHSMQGVKWFHMIDLNLGFNYTFPIKKKE